MKIHTLAQASVKSGVHPRMIQKMISEGRLAATKDTAGRWRISDASMTKLNAILKVSPGAGRPQQKYIKPIMVLFRVTPKLKKIICAIARRDGLSISSWMLLKMKNLIAR